MIGVAGGSASGKTTFSTRLHAACARVCACAHLSHDAYYKDECDVNRECGGNWDCPAALHTHELCEHITALKAGTPIEVPHYDFGVSAREVGASTRVTPPSAGLLVIIVEGLMVLHEEALRSLLDLRVYIDCDEDTRFMRRLARDTRRGERDRTVASVYKAWAASVKPAHVAYVEPTRAHAHVVVPCHGVPPAPTHLARRASKSGPATPGSPAMSPAMNADVDTDAEHTASLDPALQLVAARVERLARVHVAAGGGPAGAPRRAVRAAASGGRGGHRAGR